MIEWKDADVNYKGERSTALMVSGAVAATIFPNFNWSVWGNGVAIESGSGTDLATAKLACLSAVISWRSVVGISRRDETMIIMDEEDAAKEAVRLAMAKVDLEITKLIIEGGAWDYSHATGYTEGLQAALNAVDRVTLAAQQKTP